MKAHDATEIAYHNGYKQGRLDAAREIFRDIEEALSYRRIPYVAIDGYFEEDLATIKKNYTEGER